MRSAKESGSSTTCYSVFADFLRSGRDEMVAVLQPDVSPSSSYFLGTLSVASWCRCTPPIFKLGIVPPDGAEFFASLSTGCVTGVAYRQFLERCFIYRLPNDGAAVECRVHVIQGSNGRRAPPSPEPLTDGASVALSFLCTLGGFVRKCACFELPVLRGKCSECGAH